MKNKSSIDPGELYKHTTIGDTILDLVNLRLNYRTKCMYFSVSLVQYGEPMCLTPAPVSIECKRLTAYD